MVDVCIYIPEAYSCKFSQNNIAARDDMFEPCMLLGDGLVLEDLA